MPPDPLRINCYTAELPLATVHATLLIHYWPYHPSDASYRPGNAHFFMIVHTLYNKPVVFKVFRAQLRKSTMDLPSYLFCIQLSESISFAVPCLREIHVNCSLFHFWYHNQTSRHCQRSMMQRNTTKTGLIASLAILVCNTRICLGAKQKFYDTTSGNKTTKLYFACYQLK